MTQDLTKQIADLVAKGINELGWSPDIPTKTGIFEFEGDCHECITIAEFIVPIIEKRDAEIQLLKESKAETEGMLEAADEENQRLKQALEVAVKSLAFYTDRSNFKLIFDDENTNRAEVYENYSKYSIGDFSIKATEALTSINEIINKTKHENN